MTAFRTEAGGRIDRDRTLSFRFDGRDYAGHPGDTLASALLANGVHLVGRSFKYHRPRGILSAGVEEPNALVQLGEGALTEPNLRATAVELYEGLVAASQNRWPSLRFDLAAVNSLLSPLLPAGFYYKTFMWPPAFWPRYETLIRRLAGLGRAPSVPDPEVYDHRHAHCDVLVVGAGPSGLAAALSAARTGARVILAEQDALAGGSLLSEPDGGGPTGCSIDGRPAAAWVAAALAELASMPEVRVLTRTTVFGLYDHGFVGMLERLSDHLPPASRAGHPRQRLWKLRAGRTILATGALERPLAFAGNDRPGIMLAGAVRTYLNRFGVLAGRRALVVTNNDGAYAAALDLVAAGAEVEGVIDLRPSVEGDLPRRVREAGIPVLQGYAVARTGGARRVRSAAVRRLSPDGRGWQGPMRHLDCDLIAMSGGWQPAVHLFSQARGSLEWREETGIFVPGTGPEIVRPVGGVNGVSTLIGCLAEGARAGAEAAAAAGFSGGSAKSPPVREPIEQPARPLRIVPNRRGRKVFIDFQTDVTAADLRLAVREGYRSVEHVKRYTTVGMGTDQGKTGNIAALEILADALGTTVPAVGTTTFRPPYTPVTFGAIAGRNRGDLFDPVRHTPMQDWHEAQGARFETVGQWRRPWYYPDAGETMREAVDRECRAARRAVGILDISTLGKIDIRGPDAARFLDRLYINNWSNLPVGHCRYGLMLDDNGMVKDDGVTARLGEDRFFMTTTTGNAAAVLAWIEEWLQTEWPDLRVYASSVTEQFAAVSLCGPNAPALLAALAPDLPAGTFPPMRTRDAQVAGIDARVQSVSFSGAAGFEIYVPAGYGRALWDACLRAGRSHGIVPYGTEAMHVLRAEKGFVIVGQETDGSVTPLDLGFERMLAKAKGDFIGRRALARPEMLRPDRKQLVGLLTEDPALVLPEGTQIVAEEAVLPPAVMLGHVTSSYYSVNLGRSIALALVAGGRARHGERLYAAMASGAVPVLVTAPAFLDAAEGRADG
ncbi:MAG: sarcosine oxidase subunit alpha family protein [Alphaproteobacteria bacterium]